MSSRARVSLIILYTVVVSLSSVLITPMAKNNAKGRRKKAGRALAGNVYEGRK